MFKNRSFRKMYFVLSASIGLAVLVSLIIAVPGLSSGPIQLGYGTAIIDGRMDVGEWDDAAVVMVDVKLPPNDGGGTIPGLLFIQNDNQSLFFALKIKRSPISGTVNPTLKFDLNNSGTTDGGDDGIGMSIQKYSGLRTYDNFYTESPPCPSGRVCGLSDIDFGGTNDVYSQASADEEYTFVELSHPLDSDDDAHDMSINPGDLIGFSMGLRLFSQDTSCNSGWDCTADTYYPAHGYTQVKTFTTNQAPTAAPNGPYVFPLRAGPFNGSGSYDPDGDPLTFMWNFGDSSTGTGEYPYHDYANAGIYDLCLTVNDGYIDSEEVCTSVVIYDPGAGFVTGGGWIWSFPGTYVPEPNSTGWANFGFVAKYHKGAEIPDGQAELVYHTAGMNFHSTEYDWLVVTGDNTAKFKGKGTINGEGDYKFMIWASDGDPDSFRIKIWEEIYGEEFVTYDNSLGHPEFENGQPIGNGNILVQVVNKTVKEALDQSHTGFMLGYWFDSDDIRWQEFLPTYDNLSSIEIYLGRDGNPGNVIIEIRTLENHVLAQNFINESDIHRYGWVRVEYSEPLSLVPGTKYRIYVYADQPSSTPENRYFWFGDRDSPYDSNCETDLFYFMPDFDYAFRTPAIPN